MRQLKKPGEDRPGSGRPELEERAGSTRNAGGLTNPVEVCTKLTALHVFLPRSATGDLYTILTHWLARDCQYRVQIGHPREREGSRFATGEDAVHQKPSSDRVNCGYSERKSRRRRVSMRSAADLYTVLTVARRGKCQIHAQIPRNLEFHIICSSRRIRSSTGGWVENQLARGRDWNWAWRWDSN